MAAELAGRQTPRYDRCLSHDLRAAASNARRKTKMRLRKLLQFFSTLRAPRVLTSSDVSAVLFRWPRRGTQRQPARSGFVKRSWELRTDALRTRQKKAGSLPLMGLRRRNYSRRRPLRFMANEHLPCSIPYQLKRPARLNLTHQRAQRKRRPKKHRRPSGLLIAWFGRAFGKCWCFTPVAPKDACFAG